MKGICKTEVLCLIKFLPLWSFVLVLLLSKLLYSLGRRTMASASSSAFGAFIRPVTPVAMVGMAVGIYYSRESILEVFTGPGKYSRIALLLVLLANYKNFPFVWHIRVWSAIFRHFLSDHKFTALDNGLTKSTPAIFQPGITTSRSPLYECDYNLHKSNATYYSDLDVARTHLFSALCQQGIKQLQSKPGLVLAPDGKPAKGSWSVSLAAVHCSWKKEIQPYQKFEMWTRILAWDRKWVFIVTHFVRAGAVRPEEYTLSDGKSFLARLIGGKGKGKKTARKIKALANAALEPSANPLEPPVPHKALYASALSRYVMKMGRLTIHPEVVFDRAGLLPPRPGGWNTMSGGKPVKGAATEPVVGADGEVWDWERVEKERLKGLEIANHFLALDDLNLVFTGEDKTALGVFEDPF